MDKYTVEIKRIGTATYEVEADSIEEAEDKAWEFFESEDEDNLEYEMETGEIYKHS